MIFPRQKLPLSEKNEEWQKACIDALVDRAGYHKLNIAGTSYRELSDAYNGIVAPTRYSYVTNPYNQKGEQQRNYPAKLRNYNIIKPVIDLLLGEKARRSSGFSVVVRNPDVETRKEQAMKDMMVSHLQQELINNLNAQGIDTGQESVQQDLAAIAKKYEGDYQDMRAVMGQNAVGYLQDQLELRDQFQKGFFDWLVYGEVGSYKCINHDDVYYQIVHPEDIISPDSENAEYTEDKDWAVRKLRMSPNSLLDEFYEELTEDQIDWIENGKGRTRSEDDILEVWHCTWKSFQKVGYLTLQDGMGTEQVLEVDETYKPLKGEQIKWFWISQWWEGWRVDTDVYLRIRPQTPQRRSMSNPSHVKGLYNGKKYAFRSDTPISLVRQGIPFQDLYNIFHYRLELSIAKNKDKIMLMDINAVPRKHGWDEDKFMYFADALGTAWIDPSEEGAFGTTGFNQFQVLDMSLGQYIAAQFELLNAIKQEWEDMCGISPQRKGQVATSAGQSTTERAVIQSSVITEELFRRYEQFEQREMQGLVDLSKHAWRHGKKSEYLSSDRRQQLLQIDGEDYMEADLGVFVKSASTEAAKLDLMKQMIQPFMQNGGDFMTVMQLLDSDNFSRIKELVATAEEKRQAYEQQQNEITQQLEAQKIQQAQELEQSRQDFEREMQQAKFEHELELKAMDLQIKMGDADKDNNGKPDWVDQQKVQIERDKLNLEAQQNREANDLKEKEIEVKRIAANKPRKSST